MDYTENELWRAVRGERMVLVLERRGLVKRLKEIDHRMGELDKAENLLEGGLS